MSAQSTTGSRRPLSSDTNVLAENVAVQSFPCPLPASPPNVTVSSTTETTEELRRMRLEITELLTLILEAVSADGSDSDDSPKNRYL